MIPDNLNTYSVYIHTNLLNGKKYIGITSRKPEERWAGRGREYKGQFFYRAIKKYGWDNFSHIVLLNNLSEDEARLRENELILSNNTLSPNGYNIDVKLNGMRFTLETRKKISERTKERLLDPEVKNRSCEASRKRWSDINARKRQSQKAKETAKDPSYKEKMRKALYDNPEHRKRITGINSATRRRVVLLNDGSIYETVADASKRCGGKSNNIPDACSGKLSYSGIDKNTGDPLVWMYFDEYSSASKEYLEGLIALANNNLFGNNHRESTRTKVRCVTTGEEFDSVKSAMNKYGVTYQGVWACCIHKQKYSGKHPITGDRLVWERI